MPVMDSVISSSAAESTIAPSPPPVAGMVTWTPCAWPTAWTAWSTTALRSDRSMSKPSEPPRVDEPSRRPAASSADTCETQPGPSCQVSLTRSAIAAGLEPAAPANLRSCSLTASVSTGPNGE